MTVIDSLSLDCSKYYLLISATRVFLRSSIINLYIAIPSLLKSFFFALFPMPDDFLILDFSSSDWPKALPVQSSDAQPMTCTGFLLFPQEVRVVLLEYAAKATISSHFDGFIASLP